MKTNLTDSFKNLYIHMPFCETKCHYCDFFSLPEKKFSTSKQNYFYQTIRSELKSWSPLLKKPLNSIFLGGGTPSLVPTDLLAKFFDDLPISDSSEITLESNPSSISKSKANEWRKIGINRVSIGVQALDDDRLKWLGRVHTTNHTTTALEALIEAGFENISIDYILGVPGQTVQSITNELDFILKRFPEIKHISAYLLTLKQSNPKFPYLPSEDDQLSHLKLTQRILKSQYNFEQYEVSNYAQPGHRATHNENYWLGGSYLGVGPSAHSYFSNTKMRTKNWASLEKYAEIVTSGNTPIEWEEALTREQLRIEFIMLRLRRKEGLDLNEYATLFHEDLYKIKQQKLDFWINSGHCSLDKNQNQLYLTDEGLFLSDQIISNII